MLYILREKKKRQNNCFSHLNNIFLLECWKNFNFLERNFAQVVVFVVLANCRCKIRCVYRCGIGVEEPRVDEEEASISGASKAPERRGANPRRPAHRRRLQFHLSPPATTSQPRTLRILHSHPIPLTFYYYYLFFLPNVNLIQCL